MRRMSNFCAYLLFFAILGSLEKILLLCVADPTDGLSAVPLTRSDFQRQKPYYIPLEQRSSYVNGFNRLWVCADDKPHDQASHTQPHNKIRILGSYSSGVWKFTGVVPKRISGAMVTQIHGEVNGGNTLILRIYDENLRYYSKDLVDTDLYYRLFSLEVVYDVDKGMVTVSIDGDLKFQERGQGPHDLYFKCGVYAVQ